MTTDPLFMKIGADYYFYHNDHIGTPQKLTSVSGAVVWSAKYSSFGEASVDVGTVTNNLRFAGQYHEEETGLHYNYHRYYDPATGRYLTSDPIGLQGGINPFTYAGNNPANLIDPKGLFVAGGAITIPSAILVAAAYYAMLPPEQQRAMANDLKRFWDWLRNETTDKDEESCDTDKQKIEEAIQGIEDYIGDGTIRQNENGDLVIVSSDGTRRVRVDQKNPHPHENPHGHVEEKIDGEWVKSGPIYPKDVPHY
jgi:RHS repeat-associated protein